MRDKSHMEQVERWARFVKENPKRWKKEHKEFIDSQIRNANKFLNKLEALPGGREKVQMLKAIRGKKNL